MASLISDSCRLAYVFLNLVCDDDGRVEGDPFYLRSLLFPRDEAKTREEVEKWLAEMQGAGLILRYHDERHGGLVVQIPDWREHNVIRRDLYKPSTLPPPPKELLEEWRKRFGDDAGVEAGLYQERHSSDTEPLRLRYESVSIGKGSLGKDKVNYQKGQNEPERLPANRRHTTREPQDQNYSDGIPEGHR
ncbi:MAG: hypothetical protein HY547_07235 [Elusimicrobia bacterium]|nr:hypothetical protein [Elusimicrobiota bacterium]